MKDITKQSEETKIEWRIMGNPVVSGEATPETIMTIHPDGRVTTSDRLKPTESAALVLDQIKTQWMKDSQAVSIRELQDRIMLLEEAGIVAIHEAIHGREDDALEIWRKAMEKKP